MLSCARRIIFRQILLTLPIFRTSHFVFSTQSSAAGINGIRQASKTNATCLVTKATIFVLALVAIANAVWWPTLTHAASCDALVGRWAWFIGGEVTVNPDGTFVQQSGNAGTWECTDAARGRFTFRWRDGGFVNSLVLSPDGQGLTSTDQSQFYVTARRSGPANIPQAVNKEDCCQEAYACETKKIEAEFERKLAQCHFPGNAGCNSEAVSTKASQLNAANEKLRLCHRIGTYSDSSLSPKAGNTIPPAPASSDEFHSTERADGGCPVCMPTPGTEQASGEGGDMFGSDSPGSDRGHPPSSRPDDIYGSEPTGVDSGQLTPATCTPEFYDRDVPAASDDWRYVIGFEQEMRRCLKAQITAENLAVYALARKVKEIAVGLAIVAAPGAIDAVLHPPGVSPDPDPYLKGKAEAARLCEWALNISPLVVARCPAKGAVHTVPTTRLPSRKTLAQLLGDLSWLKEMNPTGNRKNCGNAVLGTDQYLAGGEMHPAAPMSCGTVPSQLESLLGTKFGPMKEAAEINNTIFHAGEGARGIIAADGPGGGHYFNIVNFAGDVLLLDGQLGRQVSWAEYRRMGLHSFRLMRTN
ncbi:MAG: toxin glutamine deamidase domain-containing protein [Nitrospirales bacterium]|nr:hypothetical protein [Nitrospirales bacterium]